MTRFLTGNELNFELENLFNEAKRNIVIISPYIKLHERYKSVLLTKIKNPEIGITILFGKNEDNLSKSLKQNDFEFFKQFPKIEIRYEKRLHAKYYANETTAILTSMNLYGFSQNNNIEAGILIESSIKGTLTGENQIDIDSWEYFKIVVEQSELLFEKSPIFEKKNLLSTKKFIGSEIVFDKLSGFLKTESPKKQFNEKERKIEIKIPAKKESFGFCIRSGKKITFNPEKPMTYESFKKWNEYQDAEYPEKYCHLTGEKSRGKTCVSKPILNKNWQKAKKEFNL